MSETTSKSLFFWKSNITLEKLLAVLFHFNKTLMLYFDMFMRTDFFHYITKHWGICSDSDVCEICVPAEKTCVGEQRAVDRLRRVWAGAWRLCHVDCGQWCFVFHWSLQSRVFCEVVRTSGSVGCSSPSESWGSSCECSSGLGVTRASEPLETVKVCFFLCSESEILHLPQWRSTHHPRCSPQPHTLSC